MFNLGQIVFTHHGVNQFQLVTASSGCQAVWNKWPSSVACTAGDTQHLRHRSIKKKTAMWQATSVREKPMDWAELEHV